MASYKLNMARIRGCVPAKELARAMEAYGLPDGEEFGVLNCSATDQAVFGTVIRRVEQAVQGIDAESKEVTSRPIERVNLYPFGVKPSTEVLELYAGSAGAIEQMGVFFSSCLALPTVVETIEMDVLAAVDKLARTTERFQLRSARVSEYAHNSYMAGPYAPKFLDTEHGRQFLEEHAEYVTAASVRFQAPTGKATVNLTPRACLSFSCNEDDQHVVQSILRKLA